MKRYLMIVVLLVAGCSDGHHLHYRICNTPRLHAGMTYAECIADIGRVPDRIMGNPSIPEGQEWFSATWHRHGEWIVVEVRQGRAVGILTAEDE